MEQPCPSYGHHISLWQPTAACRLSGKLSHTSGMAERVRRLQISEVGNRHTGSIELRLREGGTCSRLQSEHHLPGWLFHNPCQQVRCLLAEPLDHPWVVGSPLAFLCHRHRRLNAAQAVKDDDVLSQRYQAYRRGDVLPLELPRNASTIPAFVRLNEGTLNGLVES